MKFVVAFLLRPYAFWMAAGVAVIIYGGLGWAAYALWRHGHSLPAGAIVAVIVLTGWKYLRILNQEIESAESFECEGVLWVLRIPGLAGRGLYLLTNLGTGALVCASIALPAHLAGLPYLLGAPIGLGLGVAAINHRLRHHPIAQQFSLTGLPRAEPQ
jgi:hypothetical protein